MEELATITALRTRLAAARSAGDRIGFVATMGALHAGHAALVADVRRHATVVVMSSFVNPLQFGPAEDFARYPRDPDRDRDIATAAGVDVLFAPTAGEMYRAGEAVRVVAGEALERRDFVKLAHGGLCVHCQECKYPDCGFGKGG